jgi:hypothetical protein
MRCGKYVTFTVMKVGRRLRGRFRCRWDDDIKVDLKETEWNDVEISHLAQARENGWLLLPL